MSREGIISKTLSAKISHLMFFLSVLVVYIHTYDVSYSGEGYRAVRVIEDLISQGFCRIAVPLFFMISGYLHFTRSNIDSQILSRQIPKKVVSLIIPYLIWNIIYTVYYYALRTAANAMPEVENWLIWILKAVFLYEYNGAFWFVLQLFLLFVAAPFLYKLYKNIYVGVVACVISLVLYLFVAENTKFLLLPGLLFFSIGAMAAIHGRHIIDRELQREKIKRYMPVIAIGIFVLLMLWRVQLMDIEQDISVLRNTVLYRVFEFSAALAFWFAVDIIPFNKLTIRPWQRHSFLIYSAHGIGLSVILLGLSKLIVQRPAIRLVVYLACPLVVVGLISLCGNLIKKISPRLYGVLSGGR